MLMTLLFVGGVMDLPTIAALTLFVLLEKVLPFEALALRVGGALVLLAAAVAHTLRTANIT